MSKQKTDTAILEDTQVRSSSVQKPMAEDSNHVTKNKQDDHTNSCIKSSDNVRKNTIASNSSTISSSTNAITSGPSIMEDDNATTTTIAIGNDTYTIVASKKSASSGQPGGAMVTNKDEAQGNVTTNAKGETIRVFRRSRTGNCPKTENNNSTPSKGEDQEDDMHSSKHAEDLPAPDTPAAVKDAGSKLKNLINHLKEDDITEVDSETVISNLEYISEVIQAIILKTEVPGDDTAEREEATDDLSELQSEAVPEEVRKWLSSTFAKQESTVRRSEERPSFKSVANAIRTGIFIERIYRRMSSSQLMVMPPEVQKALKGVDDWNFDTFGLDRVSKGSPLKYIGYELLTKYGCLHKYKIPPSMLETMLHHLEVGYMSNANPYHNNLHACDVLQTTHYFISQTGLSNWMSDLEIFTSLIAAIIHDFDHTGTTNNFHINSGSGLALLYNDRAVLENHHVSAFFRMMQKHDCNIFNNMQKTDFREFRNLIIEMVLHTDMSQHFTQLKAMKNLLQQQNEHSLRWMKEWKKLKHGRLIATPGPLKPRPISFDKSKVLCLMLHSCDVSHPAKRWDLHHQWTSRCMEEFFVQGDREAELGLEYSPLCDRHNTMVPQSQIGFIDFIVNPTMTVFGDVLDLILKPLDYGRRPVPIANADSSNCDRSLPRPWNDVLAVNKQQWTAKHDAGEQSIILPSDLAAKNDSRPSSGKSDSSTERPSSSVSSHTGAVIGNARVRLREVAEEDGDENNDDLANENSMELKHSENEDGPVLKDNSSSNAKSQMYELEGKGPPTETKLVDIVDEIPENVISRPNTPGTWAFDEKEVSLHTKPPRPTSASLCSPPMPRKAPVSVDHHLRK